MIINISSTKFKQIFYDEQLYLPIRWDGKDFISTLESLYHTYQYHISKIIDSDDNIVYEKVKGCCAQIIKAVKAYLDGFPSNAFMYLNELMNNVLMQNPLKLYQKSISKLFDLSKYNDPLYLFRVVGVNDNIPYGRSRVFHTPYTLRSKVSTSRYSIAGYPSLYLGTSIELCEEEVRLNPYDKFSIASLFKIERNMEYNDTEINVIELAVKPQDFFEGLNGVQGIRRHISYNDLNDDKIRNAYILWYPLIAACSYIRVNKSDPFAVEYIVPQLLMQWVRSEINTNENNYDKLIGIRYFSCASIKASEMGFNYVFPTSGKQDKDLPFCSVLIKAFRLTKPVYLHEFDSIQDCEHYLKKMDLDSVKY